MKQSAIAEPPTITRAKARGYLKPEPTVLLCVLRQMKPEAPVLPSAYFASSG
jgi:hypothetical protein